jgi:hypothetical protein
MEEWKGTCLYFPKTIRILYGSLGLQAGCCETLVKAKT